MTPAKSTPHRGHPVDAFCGGHGKLGYIGTITGWITGKVIGESSSTMRAT